MTRDGAAPTVRIRRADPRDVDALVRMRGLMFEAMGMDDGDPSAPWRAAAASWYAHRFADPSTFAAFVADDRDLGVVGSAVGICETSPGGPRNPGGWRGELHTVCVDPRRRRQGIARRCVTATLGWFRDATPVGKVELVATPEGAGLYRSLGFVAPTYPTLQLRVGRL